MRLNGKIGIGIGVLAVGLLFIVAACAGDDPGEGAKTDVKVSKEIEDRYLRNQPIPEWNVSQYRQNVIDIETIQVEGISTTSFFFNQGAVDPIYSCPSLGLPVPSTAQLSNPEKPYIDDRENHADIILTLPNMEPNGVYTGESTATNVICVDAEGRSYNFYWEGFVSNVSAPAEWDYDNHQVKLLGPPSFEFTKASE